MRFLPFGKKFDGVKKDAEKQPKVEVEKKVEEKVEKKSPTKQHAQVKQDPNFSSHVILSMPLVTEKGTTLLQRNTYLFRVCKQATKSQIAYAIHQVYGVHPEKVRVVSNLGKSRRYGRAVGKTSAWKKAMVTLKSGQTIDTAVTS